MNITNWDYSAQNNLLLNSDSYKASHYLQYPPDSEYVSSYIEARGGVYEQSVFFGLQAFIKQYLLTPFTSEDIDVAEEILTAHGLSFNRAGWEYILQRYNGYLPLSIEALPEGMVVPVGTPLVQVVNTDPAVPWLTSYIETAMLRAIWYPTTVATVSWRIKQIIAKYLQATSDNPKEQLAFKLHDFGARGASSRESAALGGMAHLVNFQGTDTLSSLVAARQFYNADMAGFSIPASEHSTMTSWGQDQESNAYRNMIKQFGKPGAMFAVVSDSYDIYKAVSDIWGDELKQAVLDSGATLVIRPDSGKPEEVVLEVMRRLYRAFGGSVNTKGYKVLHDSVRVIQGDGVNEQSIGRILNKMELAGFAVDNIAFGMGGALLQQPNRDTMSFAMKASAICVDGKWCDVFKAPVTDTGKHSKRGRLAVVCSHKRSIRNKRYALETIRLDQLKRHDVNMLQSVFYNGELLREQSFDEIRERSESVF